MKLGKLKVFLPLFLLTGILYFVRPWLHTFLLALYTNPFILQAGVASIAFGALFYRMKGPEEIENQIDYAKAARFILGVASSVFIALLVVGAVANTAFTNVAMSQDLQEDVTEIESLPDIDNQNPRILPRTVAAEFAENSLQEPRHKLAPSDIAIDDNGTPLWSFPLQPDGDINKLLIKQKGAAFVDMTTSDSEITYSEQEMDVGIGMQVTDNINWVQSKEKFWVKYEDHFVVEHEGENYIATPYIEYDFRFKFPIIYTVPKWGGMVLTDSGGEVEYIERENIKGHEVLGSQRNYPFDLARAYVSSMEYREGILNKWFLHENQLEVAPVPGFRNEQPFMILTEDNPELFVATEPYGDASGLFEIWTIDGVTGGYEVFRLDRNQGLIGANRAVNFVRQANSRVNWADEGGSTGFAPIEPLPVIVDDKLYWQVRVVPLDSAGIAFTSFVDADSSNVYTAQSDSEIVEFLKGEDINSTAVNQTQRIGETEGSGNVTINIIEDGEVVETYTPESNDFDIQIRGR